MSSGVTLKAYDLLKALNALTPLFPKGTSEMPIGFHLAQGRLKIVCLSGVIYQSSLVTYDELAVGHATVLYHDITPLVPTSGQVVIEFTPISVIITGDGFSVELPFGYSVVEEQDFSKIVFSSISSTGFSESLKRLLNMNIEKLYNTISPITINNGLALQRFQNTWIQVRVLGLPFEAVLDSEHVKLLVKFSPTEYYVANNSTLIFKNPTGILQLPCKASTDHSKITDLMEDLGEPVQLNLEKYLDKVKQMVKIDSKQHCKITVYKNGLKTTISYNNTTMSVYSGDVESEVVAVTHLPLTLWITYLRGLDSSVIQILVGGGKICLRTQSMVIVARVLL
jgi:hypothetical protein